MDNLILTSQSNERFWMQTKTLIRSILAKYRVIYDSTDELISFLKTMLNRVRVGNAKDVFLFHIRKLESLKHNIKLLHYVYRQQLNAHYFDEYEKWMRKESKVRRKLSKKIHAINEAFGDLRLLAEELRGGRIPMGAGKVAAFELLPAMIPLYGQLLACLFLGSEALSKSGRLLRLFQKARGFFS